MKHLITVLFLAVAALSCNSDQQISVTTDTSFKSKPVSKAEVQFANTLVDFKKVSSDTLLKAEYNFKNVGTQDLIINNIQPSCSCTSSYVSKSIIHPKDSAKVVLTVSTKEKMSKNVLYTTLSANTAKKLYLLRLAFDVKG